MNWRESWQARVGLKHWLRKDWFKCYGFEDNPPPKYLALFWNLQVATEPLQDEFRYRATRLRKRLRKHRLEWFPTQVEHSLRGSNQRAWRAMRQSIKHDYPATPRVYLVLPNFPGWRELPAVILNKQRGAGDRMT